MCGDAAVVIDVRHAFDVAVHGNHSIGSAALVGSICVGLIHAPIRPIRRNIGR